MSKLFRNLLLGMGTISAAVIPAVTVVSCSDDSSTGNNILANIKAPKAYEHFVLPTNFPTAPEHTHFEFSSKILYDFVTDDSGVPQDHGTPNIENFEMTPDFGYPQVKFDVKVVPDAGYTVTTKKAITLTYEI